jgi:hypothetical protein
MAHGGAANLKDDVLEIVSKTKTTLLALRTELAHGRAIFRC